MNTVLFLFLGIAGFGTLLALVVNGDADDQEDYDGDQDVQEDYWRDM